MPPPPLSAGPGGAGSGCARRGYHDDKSGDIESKDTGKRTVDHLIEHYEGEPVSYITAGTNKDYEKDRRKFGWSPATINRTRNVLRAALHHAVKDGKLNYAPFVPALKVPKGKERWLTQGDEANRLYRALLPKRLRYLNMFVRIALGTGARVSAILQLTWDRVDLETGRIDFRVPGKVETKKRRPNAPVNDRLLRLLRAAHRVKDGNYVVERHGKPIKSIKKGFQAACKEAKLKGVTPHTLKHTYITWHLRAGTPIWQVAGLTNTSPATIEKHYGHHAQDSLKEAANAVLGNSSHKALISQTTGSNQKA